MTYTWYLLFNKTEFEATGLVSRTLDVIMEGRGEEQILVTQGNTTAVLHDDTFLPVQFLDHNPYTRDGKAVYLDEDNNVWLGFEVVP